MGTFMGYLLTGSIFISFALWWTYAILTRYFAAIRLRPTTPKFRNSVSYPAKICCCRFSFPLESVLKVVLCTGALIGEIVTGIDNNQFVHIENGQYATMFSFFIASGLIDILIHYRVPLPRNIDYAFFLICFSVEGLLFMFHLHGRSLLDDTVHQLLLYVITACIASCLAEVRWPHSIIAGLCRCFFVFLQGSWFIQVAFILYPPFHDFIKWDQKSHKHIMLCTIIFAWHLFFIAGFMLVVTLVKGRYHRVSWAQIQQFSDDSDGNGIYQRGFNTSRECLINMNTVSRNREYLDDPLDNTESKTGLLE